MILQSILSILSPFASMADLLERNLPLLFIKVLKGLGIRPNESNCI